MALRAPRLLPSLPLPAHSGGATAGGRRHRPAGGRRSLAGFGLLGIAAVLLLPRALPGSPAPGTAATATAQLPLQAEDGKAPLGSPALGAADTAAAGQLPLQVEDGKSRGTVAAQVAEWARKAGSGPASAALLALAEVVAILICMPGYSTIEYAAGALFGFFWGCVTIFVAKCLAALITYMLIRTLRDSAWGRWAEQRVMGSERGGQLAARIQKGIESSSFKFSLLVRCSPLPAWISNYALPLAGVPFPTYMAASVIGMLPPLITSVYAGAVAAAVAASFSGSGTASGPGGIVGVLAVGVSILSSTLLVHQLSSVAIDESSGELSQAEAGTGVAEGRAPEQI